jgi:hypothetical protein
MPNDEVLRDDAADTLSVASSAVKPGIGSKVAIAGTVFRLVKRYPVAALLIGGIALAVYINRRRHGSASVPSY